MGRTPWEDKFSQPTLADLLSGIVDTERSAAASELVGRLDSYAGVRRAVRWEGMPWRWTVVYTAEMDPTRAWTYVVPDPARVQVCVPLTIAMVQVLPMKRLKRLVRDGIAHSKVVSGVYWPSWEVRSTAEVEEVLDLAARKHRYITMGEIGTAGTGPRVQ